MGRLTSGERCVCGLNPWTGVLQTCLLHYGELKRETSRRAQRPYRKQKPRRNRVATVNA